MDNFVKIPFDFIEKYVRFTKPEYIQVYLYVKYTCEKNGSFPSSEAVAKALDISVAKAEFILEYWASRNELTESKSALFAEVASAKADGSSKTQLIKRIRSTKPAYSQAEIDTVSAANKQISGLFYQAETILDKVLTASDMELLFSFHDWLGLPVEVIMMLLSYAAKRGKTTKHYLETVAIDWAEKGIDTYEAAEDYVSRLEAADSAEHSIRSILGIYDRALSSTERKYIKLWANEMQIPLELISLAYDKTITATGKLNYGYMNKILENWISCGYQNVQDVNAAEEEFYKNGGGIKPTRDKKPKKSGFNNYEDTNKTDYAELERQLLDMLSEE